MTVDGRGSEEDLARLPGDKDGPMVKLCILIGKPVEQELGTTGIKAEEIGLVEP